MPRVTTASLALLLVAGCQLAPPHTRPDLPVEERYPPAYAGDVEQGVPADGLGWRELIIDPRLEAVIAAALDNDLDESLARIAEARGLYRIVDADRLPTVAARAGATRGRLPEVDGGPATFDRTSIGVAVPAFELDFWGRVRNLSEAARSRFLATVEAQRAFRLVLLRDVAATYLAALEMAERIALAEATVASREDGLRIARVRFDAGITSALDFRQAESLLTQAEAQLARLRLAKAQLDNLLAVLVRGPIPGELPPAAPLGAQVADTALAAGLPSELLLARPDVVAAEERLRAARADVGAARAAFFPSISLTGDLGFASGELTDLVGSDGLTWSFGPSISLPIFDRGRRRGILTVAEAREEIAIVEYDRTVQVAFQEVANALAARRYFADQVAAQERGLVAQRQIAELARARYREGVVGYLEVLDAERTLFAAEQDLLEIRRAQVENQIALYVALGGGVADGLTD